MSLRTAISAFAIALAAFLVVALAPTGASAHGSAPHPHAAKYVSDSAVTRDAATAAPAELRAQAPLSSDYQGNVDCGERGCCSAGHCSGCGPALAPGVWTCLRLPSDLALPNPDASLPASLAREGPPRPPKSFA